MEKKQTASVIQYGVTVVVSSAVILLFLFLAFNSAPLRDFIAWFEPRMIVFLLFGWALLSIISLTFFHKDKLSRTERDVNLINGLRANRFILSFFNILIPCLVIILFTLPLFQSWTTTDPGLQMPSYFALKGFIPWSDASEYYCGAERLLIDGKLGEFNKWRPLNTTLLSARLALTNHDFRKAMIIQALLLGVACYWATGAVAADFGFLTGLLFFTLSLAFGRLFVQTTMSENLGLTFGLISFTLFWRNLRLNKLWIFVSALILLSIALNARSGPFLILASIMLWGVIFFKKRRYGSFLIISIFILAIISGFLLQGAVNYLYAGTFSVGHENLFFALYGLVSGGKEWAGIYEEFPELNSMPLSLQGRYMCKKLFERALNRPSELIKGLCRYSWVSLKSFYWDISTGMGLNLRKLTVELLSNSKNYFLSAKIIIKLLPAIFLFLKLAVSGLLFIILVRFFLLKGQAPGVSFILFGWAGHIVSLPFFYFVGGLRSLAAIFPFIASGITISLKPPDGCLEKEKQSLFRGVSVFAPLSVGIALVITALIGPIIAKRFEKSVFPDSSFVKDPSSVIAYVGPGSPHLNIMSDSPSVETFAPIISDNDFRNDATFGLNDEPLVLSRIKAPATFLLVYDIQNKERAHIIGPPNIVGERRRLMHFTVRKDTTGLYSYALKFRPLDTKTTPR